MGKSLPTRGLKRGSWSRSEALQVYWQGKSRPFKGMLFALSPKKTTFYTGFKKYSFSSALSNMLCCLSAEGYLQRIYPRRL